MTSIEPSDALSSLHAELSARIDWWPNVDSLDFVNDPAESGPYCPRTDFEEPNIGQHALKSTQKNYIFLEYESWLCESLRNLKSMDDSEARSNIEDRVIQELVRINRLKEIEWSGQRSKHGIEGAVVNTECHFTHKYPDATLLAVHVTVLVMHILYHVTRRGTAVLLAGLKCILMGRRFRSTDSLARDVPNDPRRLIALYHLDPVLHSYICCPACHYLYPYSIRSITTSKTKKRKSSALSGEYLDPSTENVGSNDNARAADAHSNLAPSAPIHCTHLRVPLGAVCGERLFDRVTIKGNSHMVPRLKYHAQDLKQWIGWLLSRPTIEDEVFKAFRRPRKERMEDIWDGGHLCRICLSKDERFLPGPENETRLAFSFSMDSFNPYHLKQAKQTVSSTAIWLILLNLPSHLRYRRENMFLSGIVPGPDKPSLSDINHPINLLVDVLREFFDPGVLYSHTARHPHGCRVRAILVPVVADMLAARQASGFASATARNFCTLCYLNIQDIENLDRRDWPKRDAGEHARVARQWKDAKDTEAQEDLFKNYGIRWSPLLSLPYWNPILFTAIEPMHVFDAGLFQNHCRWVWGINPTAVSGGGLPDAPIDRPSDSDLSKWYDAISGLEQPDGVRKQLKHCPVNVLWHICNDNNLRCANLRNKSQLVENIVHWHSQHPMVSSSGSRSTHSPHYNTRSTVPVQPAVSSSGSESLTPQTGVSDTESLRSCEGSIATDDSREGVQSDVDQIAVDKCINQLNNRKPKKTVMRSTKAVLISVCRGYCQMEEDEVNALKNKDDLYNAAATWVENNVPLPENSGQGANGKASTTGAILGSDIMTAVWEDMARTQLPSWVTNVPHNWGTAARGKLSANNWRVICTVHLPITLIRLWGGDDAPEDRKAKLENFMDLVRAVQIANLRSISKDDINRYEHYIHQYLDRFKTLYKRAKVKPIHHAALHYGDVLRGFGPAHTHGAAFYERYIYSMQSENHNMKLGELELTFMRSSAREAKLQALLSDHSEIRESVGELVKTHEAFRAEDVRGTRLAHMVDTAQLAQQPDLIFDRACLRDTSVPEVLLPPLVQFLNQKYTTATYSSDGSSGSIPVSPKAKFFDKFSFRGVQYSTKSSRIRNSHILYRGNALEPRPGQIIYAFLHHQIHNGEVPFICLCICPYLPVQEELEDVDKSYKRFGFAGGFLTAQGLGPPVIVDASSIISHVAITPLEIKGCKALHILPMDRLMQMSITCTEDNVVEDGTDI